MITFFIYLVVITLFYHNQYAQQILLVRYIAEVATNLNFGSHKFIKLTRSEPHFKSNEGTFIYF